jgi:hypothetical protein
MKRAAIGVRMHSGWGALVAICINAGSVEVLDRRRITITVPETPGAIQPYHYAKKLKLDQAEKFLVSCFAESQRLAFTALREVAEQLRERKYHVTGAAFLLASGRPLPPLAKILASHAAIHAAEGEFFRQAFSQACKDLELSVTGFRERDLATTVQKAFGKAAGGIQKQVSTLGRTLGPPWTADQKAAALAASLLLSDS